MTRYFCLSLVVILTAYAPIHAQRNDPPKNFTNSIGMKFVWIPPGSFMMGSPKEEKKRGDDETQHKVTLTEGFYIGKYTVTQEQWQEVMGNNPSKFKGEKNLPVENVSWEDCQEFIRKLREKDKKPYRLPTEAEWEYSCRAGTTTPFYFGETISTDQANYNGTYAYGDGKKGVYREKTTPVGSFPANAWGLHDMHGNVFQWCQDWYGDYPQKDVVDPQGPVQGKGRVLRGGSWLFDPVNSRSAFRFGIEPGSRSHYFGLRVCFSVASAGSALENPNSSNSASATLTAAFATSPGEYFEAKRPCIAAAAKKCRRVIPSFPCFVEVGNVGKAELIGVISGSPEKGVQKSGAARRAELRPFMGH